MARLQQVYETFQESCWSYDDTRFAGGNDNETLQEKMQLITKLSLFAAMTT